MQTPASRASGSSPRGFEARAYGAGRTAPAATLAAAVAVLVGASGATAQDAPLRFVTGNDFGDFSGEALEEGGMAAQLVREALAAVGDEVEMTFEDWQPGYDAALAGEWDGAFPWYHLPERDVGFVFSDSIYELVERVFHLEGDPDLPDIRGAEDLAGLNLCYPAGWGAPVAIQAMFEDGTLQRTEPGDMSRCFDLLANEQVDAVLSPQLQGYETVEAHPTLDAFDVSTASWEVRINTLSVLVPKALGRDVACARVARLNAGLAAARANGLYDAVARRWFGPLAQLADPSERYELTRRDGDLIEGEALGVSAQRFLIDTGADGIQRVPLDDVAWLRRAGVDEFDAARDWCLSEDAADAGPTSDANDGPTDGGPTDGGSTDGGVAASGPERTLAVAGPVPLAAELVPALLSGWLGREVRAESDAAFSVTSPSNDPRRPDGLVVRARGTAGAFDALATSAAELALADRRPTADERAALAALDTFPSEATEHVFALEALAPVVHASRELEAVELQALRDALGSGDASWSALGAPDDEAIVTVHIEQHLGASLDAPDNDFAGLPAPAADVRLHPTREDVLAAVASDPDALGLVSQREAEGAEDAGRADYLGSGVRPLAVSDCGLLHAPSAFAARTEEYPLSRRLYMYYSPKRENGFAGAFVRHAQSEVGQAVVAEHGLVDLSIEPAPADEREGALENLRRTGVQNADVGDRLAEAMNGATRLSTTFRFRTGSSRLDARATRDAERLAAWLRERSLGAEDIELVGYADSRGGYGRNCQLSSLRTASVAEALAREGVDGELSLVPACEEAPVACNATAAGQDLNRRVEVWLRDGSGA